MLVISDYVGRANMLTALMSGRALTATELAQEAGVIPQTASSHLAKLEAGQIVTPRKQGRHRYFTLSGSDIVEALEVLMGIANRVGHNRVRTGPKDPELRKARVCYDHLAGSFGAALLDRFYDLGWARRMPDSRIVRFSDAGEKSFRDLINP